MSIIESAKLELELINFGEEDTKVMIELLEKFLDHWDSGGAVWAVAPIFQKLLAGKPLGPLTGVDEEWFIHDFDDHCYAQNKRCGSVFKRRDGTAYDIDNYYDENGKPKNITFPYEPGSEVSSPVAVFGD